MSVAEFGSLRWLEGRWRGEDASGAPFFEGYRFVNDSTIHSYSFAAADGPATDSSAITLRAGIATSGSGGSRWAVSELADGHVHFVPLEGARNAFRWVRRSADEWTAILTWPAAADRPAREVVYAMRRLRP